MSAEKTGVVRSAELSSNIFSETPKNRFTSSQDIGYHPRTLEAVGNPRHVGTGWQMAISRTRAGSKHWVLGSQLKVRQSQLKPQRRGYWKSTPGLTGVEGS
jgi:hypothetical protein